VHPRLPVERIDLEPRVVGERGQAVELARSKRLDAGIVLEGLAGLLGLGPLTQFGGGNELPPGESERLADLLELVAVAGGDHHAAPGWHQRAAGLRAR
jgi:hypothetical protein